MSLDDFENIPEWPCVFGPARQLAYIVEDIDAAITVWKSRGVEAFLITRDVSPLQNAFYRGEKARKSDVTIAFGYWGNIQIELIEPQHNHLSIYTEAQKRSLTGVHHYAVCVEDFAASYNFALDNGYEVVVDSGVDGLARMSYIEHSQSGLILEVVEWNNLTKPYFDAIREMWDNAVVAGQDREFDLATLTPKRALIKLLGRFLFRKLTGKIKPTRRPVAIG